MRVLLIPIGSAGDVFPYLGIGVELKRRGHAVTVLTSPYFEPHIRRLGMEFHSLEVVRDNEEFPKDPLFWDPRRSFEFMMRRVLLPAIPEVYRFILDHFRIEDAIVVAPSLAFGARLAQEKGMPMVTIVLQTTILRTLYDTPILFPGMDLITAMPRWLKRIFFHLLDREVDHIVTPFLNAFRIEIGLPPVKGVFRWMESPDGVIGLFPEWYAAPQPDWPPQLRLTGFLLYDTLGEESFPDALEAFLKAGEPPLIFTGGSTMQQGRWFFEQSLQACLQLGCRGVLITPQYDQIPEKLPPTIFHCDYAPFSRLFLRGKMIIHTGGIGTTAQALAAGVPQLIVPLVNDQFEQASRVKRLGAGRVIAKKDFNAASVARKIQKILATPGITQRARELSQRVDGPRSIALACDLIEKTQKGIAC